MQTLPLSHFGQRLANNLRVATQVANTAGHEKIQVAGVADTVYSAYEKLRRAAEYTEQHLLQRAACERFLRRKLLFGNGQPESLGLELVTELTQAGYLENNSIPASLPGQIDHFIKQYLHLQQTMTRQHGVRKETASDWIIEILSASIEKLLRPHPITDAYIDFVYTHFHDQIDRHAFYDIDDETFETALYCAIHRMIFKSDMATIRFYMVVKRGSNTAAGIVAACRATDEHMQSRLTNRLARLVNHHGAPFRVLRNVITHDPNSAELVHHRPKLLARIRREVEEQTQKTHSKVIKAILRAIAFVFITKILIGLAIEIPYDYFVYGTIAAIPLLINLLFPPVYMATALLSVGKPQTANTEAIVDKTDRILYQTSHPLPPYTLRQRIDSRQLNAIFNVIYAIVFIATIGLATWLLYLLHFTPVHIVIFFLFFSAVSFLRFRILLAAKELDVVERKHGFLTTVSDFFYTPFVQLGHWLSDRYRQLNLVNLLLDIIIEMPLKTVLRYAQLWVGFMRDKRDEI